MLHVEVRGVVQGVGFRWYARERARRLGLAGWVRNCEDGAVEVAAEGDASAVSMFLDDLRTGPPGAIVRDVITLPAEPLGPLQRPFTILR